LKIDPINHNNMAKHNKMDTDQLTTKTKRVLGAILASLFLSAVSLPATAALQGRLLLETSPGIFEHQAYYDTVLDITWLADANLAQVQDFEVVGINPVGFMEFDLVDDWLYGMNHYDDLTGVPQIDGDGWLGINTWRAPTLSAVVDGSADFNTTFSVLGDTDNGYNIHAPGTIYEDWTTTTGGSELSYMFYQHLGGTPNCNPDPGDPTCTNPNLDPGIGTMEPFKNVGSGSDNYWNNLAVNDGFAWIFDFENGQQTAQSRSLNGVVWAVADGDVAAAPVPVPAAVYLFGSGLLGMITLARRKRNTSGGVTTG
jgi:hypothetical protein